MYRATKPQVTLEFTARVPPYNPGEVATFGLDEARRYLGLKVRGVAAARIVQAPNSATQPTDVTHVGGGWYEVPGFPEKIKGKAEAIAALNRGRTK